MWNKWTRRIICGMTILLFISVLFIIFADILNIVFNYLQTFLFVMKPTNYKELARAIPLSFDVEAIIKSSMYISELRHIVRPKTIMYAYEFHVIVPVDFIWNPEILEQVRTIAQAIEGCEFKQRDFKVLALYCQMDQTGAFLEFLRLLSTPGLFDNATAGSLPFFTKTEVITLDQARILIDEAMNNFVQLEKKT